MRRLWQIKKLPKYQSEDGESYKSPSMCRSIVLKTQRGVSLFFGERKGGRIQWNLPHQPPYKKGVKEIYNPIGWNYSSPNSRTIDSSYLLIASFSCS